MKKGVFVVSGCAGECEGRWVYGWVGTGLRKGSRWVVSCLFLSHSCGLFSGSGYYFRAGWLGRYTGRWSHTYSGRLWYKSMMTTVMKVMKLHFTIHSFLSKR